MKEVFSNIRIVNNWLRNSMEQKKLNSVMLYIIYISSIYHYICIETLNINELISSFVEKTEWIEKMFSFH